MVEIKKTGKVWMDGKLIPWDEAKIHVACHAVHYGDGVFEGIRCYECNDGRHAIFRLDAHIHRMMEGASFLDIKIPYSFQEIHSAIVETAKANNLQDGDYIRPLVIVGEGQMGLSAKGNPVHLIIMTWSWGVGYFGEDAFNKGISVMISKKWRRDNRVLPFHVKAVGNYVNSGLVKREAVAAGYDESLVKDMDNRIVEASAANIFVVKAGKLITPPDNAPILRGITRESIIRIAKVLKIEVEDTFITEHRLFTADEAFLCGTAAEFTPIREVEGRCIRFCPGPITKQLRDVFFQAVRGELPEYSHWLNKLKK